VKHSLNIECSARTLLGAAAVCLLLMNSGCNGAPLSDANAAGSIGSPPASVQGSGDWGMSLLAGGSVGLGQYPAKFTFDVTAAPSCANDFVVFNTSLAGAAGTTANIVAFNQLYSTQGLVGGLCNQDGPSVYWSYFTGTGTAVTSVVLSATGDKVAFVENVGTTANLRILKWKAGQGAGTGSPAGVDQNISGSNWSTCTAGNSCIASIAFSGAAATDTRSAPYYDYSTDALYVGDDSGRMHKFTGVFSGTPSEVTANWPISINTGTVLTSPVYDGVSGNIYVGDSTGRLSFIREVGSTKGTCTPQPCLNATNLSVGSNNDGAIVDAPIVDGTNGFVFAVDGTETANNGTILQASTDFTTHVTRLAIGSNSGGTTVLYSGTFDQNYINSSIATISAGHMYVCGRDPNFGGDRPAVWQLNFANNTGIMSLGSDLASFVSSNSRACSPVTEFYNPNGGGAGVAKDWIFFSTGNTANNGGNNSNNPIFGTGCQTGTNSNKGCVISIEVTNGATWPPTLPSALIRAQPLPGFNAGSTSGIIVDNSSTSSQASSIYFSLGTNSTGTGPGVPSCYTTAGVGCAVKLTQSALN
jgi:hypothetical protein